MNKRSLNHFKRMSATILSAALLLSGVPVLTVSAEETVAMTINNASDWETFCDCLNDSTYEGFSGKTVQLGNDITVSRAASEQGKEFRGTFDGQGHTLTFNATDALDYCAPFRFTAGNPVFRDLILDGTINTPNAYAAGLIGWLYGDVTIERCTSSVEITSNGSAGGFVGLCEHDVAFTDCVSSAVIQNSGGNSSGFVAWSRDSAHTISFDGCLFNGKLLKSNGTGSSNGCFIGWKGDSKTVTLDNCLCAPAALESGEEYASENSVVFCRQHNDELPATLTNCYYFGAPFGTAQGKQARSVSADENVTVENVALTGDATAYSLSDITAYSYGGLSCGGSLYYGKGDIVALTLSHAERDGYDFNGYSVSAGTLWSDDFLTMPNADVIVSANYVPHPASYMDGTTLVLKGMLSKSGESGNIVLPDGASAYSIQKIRVDEAGAIFPENTSGMFKGFPNVTEIDLSGADIGQVNDMSLMFCNCDKLNVVDMSGLDTTGAEDMSGMFMNCTLLETVYVGSKWSADGAACDDMFTNCYNLTGGEGTTFDGDHTGKDYARIDGGESAPGYLTGKYAVIVDESIVNGAVTANYRSAVKDTTVTLTVTPNEDYKIGGVTLNGAQLAAAYGVYSFDMPAQDVTITAAFDFSDGVGARLVGHSISLNGDIGVNFYMELDATIAADPDLYMHFTIPSGSKTLDQDVSIQDAGRSGSYYIFKCNVAAKEMKSTIYAQLNKGEPIGTKYEYSVKQYADYLIEHADQNGTDEQKLYARAKPLVEAMLTYGGNAQYYFGGGTKPADIETVIPEYSGTIYEDDLPNGVSFEGATLSLKSQTTLSLYFTSDHDITLTCNGSKTETSHNGSEYVIRIRDIPSSELDNLFTVAIDGKDAVTYSPLVYCYQAQQSSGDAKLINTVRALYLYWKAAEEYFN